MPKVNPKFLYREIFKKSYEIVRNNKFLWFFGFFAAAFGALGEFDSVFKDYGGITTTSDNIFSLQNLYQGGLFWTIFENIKSFFTQFPWQAFFIILITIVIFVFIYWLAVVSQIALFDSTNKISKKKKTGFADGYRTGGQFFLPVLLINIGFRILLYGFFVVIASPLLSWFLVSENLWGGILFVILLFLIYIPISIIVSFIIKYSIAFIVIKGQKTWDAVKSAWKLFKENWLVSIEMGVILLFLGLLVGIGILLVLGLSAVPFVLIGIAALFFGSSTGLAVAVILGALTWLVIISIIGSGYVAFQYSSWTLLFLDLVGSKAESKLQRLVNKLTG